MTPRLVTLCLIAACSAPAATPVVSVPDPIVGKVEEGEDLIGMPAPPLDGVVWIDGKAHPLGEDRGKVVLVRWWTDTCPLCANTAPAVRALAKKYGDGLAVRAIYHNKVRGRDIAPSDVRVMNERTGFVGVVGHDDGWRVLRRWWLDAGGRRFTSVTFVVGKRGRIRMIHTGGEFHRKDEGTCQFEPAKCAEEFEAIDKAIGALLDENL